MSSKYNDLTSVLQVLGCVYKNPSLLEERDKYPLTDADFADEFHRATFGALFKLYELGAREFNLQQINDFFSTRPKYEAIYKLNKGDEWLLKTAETCTPTAFDYYYQRLKKFSLLRAYDNCGIDVSDIYDIDNILDVKKKQLQEEKLDNATLESIADTIDAKLSQIRIDYVNGVDGHVYDAAEDIEDLVDSLKEHPEVGMPLFGSMFNTVTRGARLRKFYLRSAATGVGKAVPNYTIIPTPTGYRTVGEIRPGDYIFGQDGKPTKVLKIYPQPEVKTVWRITFEDGRRAKCCEEHLWEYRINGSTFVGDTKELNKLLNAKNEIFIPVNGKVNFPKSDKKVCYREYNLNNDRLSGNIEQREQALEDLVPNYKTKDSFIFKTDNPLIIDFFINLCRSLGLVPYVLRRNINNNYQLIKVYKQETLAIVDIEKTEERTYMTCFTVDNKSHLFLMNDYIVTHNTRSMIADACYIACEKIYNQDFGWINTHGCCASTLFITTEQDITEIQTMMLAFIADVNEEHILQGKYEGDEEERIKTAIQILKNSKLYVKELPDFSLQDVEDVIKTAIREQEVSYIFHDYVHTSMKILEEITRRSGGVKLREDNILFMLSNKIKDICNKYGVFIMSATQLNGQWAESETPDQNLLRGAKSIADKIDMGAILLSVTKEDIESLQPVLEGTAFDIPTIKMSIYKNRRGRYKSVYLWCKADLGTCRITPMFCTTWGYELIDIHNTKIYIDENSCAFKMTEVD